MKQESTHAYFSPSASSRWLNCPASLKLYEKLEKEKTNKYAHEGTVCHEIAADCLVNKTDASKYLGRVLEDVAITPELVDGMQLYIDEVKGLTKEFEAIGGGIEQKVTINEDCSGTVDALIWNKDTLVCIDLKMGAGVVVSAQDNTQLKIYSAGALKWLYEKYKLRPTKVVNYIIQPRTPNPIRGAKYTTKEILKFIQDDVVPILRMKKTGELESLPCVPGEVQCKWCRIKDCTARASKAIADATRAFAPFTEEEIPVVADTTEKKTLDLNELGELKKNFKFIADWILSVDKYLLDAALAGEEIQGYKLVAGRANRKWGVDENTIAALLTGLEKEPYTKKIVSPAQAEKLLGKKVAIEEQLETFIVRPKGAPTLVENSDKRPAIKEAKEDIGVLISDIVEPVEAATVPKEEDVVKVVIEKNIGVEENGKPPRKGSKKRAIHDAGLAGQRTLTDVAEEIGCSLELIKKHLRLLNEKNGLNYKIYSDDTFIVY